MKKLLVLCAFGLQALFAPSAFADLEHHDKAMGYHLVLPEPLEEFGRFQVWQADLDMRIFSGSCEKEETDEEFCVITFSLPKECRDDFIETFEEMFSTFIDEEIGPFESIMPLVDLDCPTQALRFFQKDSIQFAEFDFEDEALCMDMHLFERKENVVGIITIASLDGLEEDPFDPDAFSKAVLETLIFEEE